HRPRAGLRLGIPRHMLTAEDIEWAAEALAEATRAGKPIQPLTETWPGLGVQDAYAIQLQGVRTALDSGRWVVGYKIGLTPAAMQERLGLPRPDLGHLREPTGAPLS